MNKFKAGDIVTINENITSEIFLLDFLPSFVSHPINGSGFSIKGFEDHCIEKLDKNSVALICRTWEKEDYAPNAYECIINGIRGFIVDLSEESKGLDNCLVKVDV